jgi:hypothetical protein
LQELRALADSDVRTGKIVIDLYFTIKTNERGVKTLGCNYNLIGFNYFPSLVFYSFIHSSQLQSKMENAEVLELTVRRVENILQSQAQGTTRVSMLLYCYHNVTTVPVCFGVFEIT